MGLRTQSTSIFQSTMNVNALNVNDNDQLFVPVGVTVAQIGIGGSAVFSNAVNSSLFNAGTLFNVDPNSAGAVVFDFSNIKIDNVATGVIAGATVALSVGSINGADVVTNAGVITATADPNTYTVTGVLLHNTPVLMDLTN